MRIATMKNTRMDDDTENGNDGHVDTCACNHARENPDPHLGCDRGIDAARSPAGDNP